jgi:hypothetical protein
VHITEMATTKTTIVIARLLRRVLSIVPVEKKQMRTKITVNSNYEVSIPYTFLTNPILVYGSSSKYPFLCCLLLLIPYLLPSF